MGHFRRRAFLVGKVEVLVELVGEVVVFFDGCAGEAGELGGEVYEGVG